MPPIQYLNASDGTPTHVIIPIDEFKRDFVPIGVTNVEIASEPVPEPESLLSADKLFIKLPHGGPNAKIDVHAFAHAFCQRGTTDTVLPVIPIAKKTQKLGDFEGTRDDNNKVVVGPVNGLDAMLRRCCLPEGSPYRDTMQATTAVVDALVETGLFKRTTQSMGGFYRPVQCLSIVEEKMVAFVNELGEPNHPIDPHRLVIPW